MKKLYDALVEFVTTVDEKYCIANDNGSNKNLEEQFRLLACNFLYGGYISVNDRYRIYIRTVEFYFHCELEGEQYIHDPGMYHRNNFTRKTIEKCPSYFPIGALNMHESGVDITFEKQDVFRASVLIRRFDVYEPSTGRWHNNERRSTYIYDYIQQGATLLDGLNIRWVDDCTDCGYDLKGEGWFDVTARVNMVRWERKDGDWAKSISPDGYIPDMRQWSYARKYSPQL